MATYFCSDLHGEYDLFCRLLDKIGFSDIDSLYVLGDFIDKGKASFRLAELLMKLKNVKALIGNHEYYFLRYYSYCVNEYADGRIDDIWEKLCEYFPENDSVGRLDDIADYIESLPYYYEAEDFVCVHAGVELYKSGIIKPMPQQDYHFLLFDRSFKDDSVIPIDSKTILFGHTPCSYKNGVGNFNKTLRKGLKSGSKLSDYAKIQLDTGAFLTGMIGCLRKEDMCEFYIKR